MSKYMAIFFMLINTLVFAATKNLWEVKTVKFEVVEKTNINNQKREVAYSVDFKLPSKIRKEVTLPELNKGEIYIYDYSKDKKIVYLPIFNETKESKILDDENRIVKALNKVIEEEKNNINFSKKYKSKQPQSLKIDEQVTIDIEKYIETAGYVFPEVIVVKDGETKVGEIKITKVKVNQRGKMIFLKNKGIIISKKDIEEADRYITVFMEDYGKVSTIVKGIRKSKRRDKTAADILSLTEFQFYRKNDNIIISSFNSVKNYQNIKSDIDKINLAFYIFSILNQILVENGRNRKLYDLLEKTLDFLENSKDERKNYLLVLFFLYNIIKEEGISIEGDLRELGVGERPKTLSKELKEILEHLFDDNLKVVIENEEYKLDTIKEAILKLEKYINFNLDTYIDAQKILWGDLVW